MIRATALLLVLSVASGCRHGQPATPPGSANTTTSSRGYQRISLEQLHQEMTAYTAWANGRVKAAAASIEAAADDELTRYEALRLKTLVISTQRGLLLSRDPRDAFTDSWVFVVQRRNFMTSDTAPAIYATWRAQLLQMTQELESELKRIGGLFMAPEELARAEVAVHAYANEHPVPGMFDAPHVRPSSVAREDKSAGLGAIINVPLAPFSALEGVDTGAAALSEVAQAADRLTILAATMPEEARWQAEIYNYDLLGREPLKTTLEDFHRVSESLAHMTQVVESMPEDVRRQVEDVFNELDSSSGNVQSTLQQAKAAADALTAAADSANQLVESTSTLLRDAGLTGADAGPPSDPETPSEIEQLTAVARETRSTVIEARGLITELDELLQDSKVLEERILAVDQAAGASIDHAAGRVRDLIRFATLQGALLIGVAFVAAVLYRLVAVRIVKPR